MLDSFFRLSVTVVEAGDSSNFTRNFRSCFLQKGWTFWVTFKKFAWKFAPKNNFPASTRQGKYEYVHPYLAMLTIDCYISVAMYLMHIARHLIIFWESSSRCWSTLSFEFITYVCNEFSRSCLWQWQSNQWEVQTHPPWRGWEKAEWPWLQTGLYHSMWQMTLIVLHLTSLVHPSPAEQEVKRIFGLWSNFGLAASMISVILGIIPLYTYSLTNGGKNSFWRQKQYIWPRNEPC